VVRLCYGGILFGRRRHTFFDRGEFFGENAMTLLLRGNCHQEFFRMKNQTKPLFERGESWLLKQEPVLQQHWHNSQKECISPHSFFLVVFLVTLHIVFFLPTRNGTPPVLRQQWRDSKKECAFLHTYT